MNVRKFLVVLICISWVVYPAVVAFAQVQPPVPAPTSSPVILDGEEVFSVGSFKAYTSEMRVKRISGVLQQAAENYKISPQSLTYVDDPISTDIMAGDQVLFSVFDGDATILGVSRADLGPHILSKIRPAIEKYRSQRAPRNLLISSLYALLATLALGVLLVVFSRANRRFMGWALARVQRVQVRSHEVVRADWALRVVQGVWGPIRLGIVCGLALVYLQLVLSLFPWTSPFASQLLSYLVVPLKVMASSIAPQAPGLLFIAVLIVVAIYFLKLTRFVFSEIERGRIAITGFYPDWSRPTYNIVRVLVIAFTLVVAFPHIPGSSSPAFQGVSVFAGILLSLGSTSAVANLVAGVLLTYTRAFKLDDVVTIGESTGVVTAVSMFVTNIRTPRNEEISIPNSMVLSGHVINFSKAAREKGLFLRTAVTIGYGTPWRQVEGLLLMAAERTSGLLREPAPYVLQTALSDFYISYELNVATTEPKRMRYVYSELHANIQDAFNEYNVQIMSPHYEADRDVPTSVPKEQWFAPPASFPREKAG